MSATSYYHDSWPTPAGAVAYHDRMARGGQIAPPPLYHGSPSPEYDNEILPMPRSPSPMDVWPGPRAPRMPQTSNPHNETLRQGPARTPNVQYQEKDSFPFGGTAVPTDGQRSVTPSRKPVGGW